MTNYIEQLMKATGVQKRGTIDCCSIKEYFECQDRYNCANCEKCRSIEYPAFTPEKQLELIKLIVDKCQEIKIYKNKCMDSFLFQAQENWGEYEYKADVGNFGSCLATLILELLKNNKLDKSEVKRILEDDQLRTHKSHER